MEEKKTIRKQDYCRFLRAKNPFGLLEGGGTPFMLEDANTICWCIKTQAGMGPDHGLVEPASCTKGRSCFVSPDV
jgi:hypothetical protein